MKNPRDTMSAQEFDRLEQAYMNHPMIRDSDIDYPGSRAFNDMAIRASFALAIAATAVGGALGVKSGLELHNVNTARESLPAQITDLGERMNGSASRDVKNALHNAAVAVIVRANPELARADFVYDESGNGVEVNSYEQHKAYIEPRPLAFAFKQSLEAVHAEKKADFLLSLAIPGVFLVAAGVGVAAFRNERKNLDLDVITFEPPYIPDWNSMASDFPPTPPTFPKPKKPNPGHLSLVR